MIVRNKLPSHLLTLVSLLSSLTISAVATAQDEQRWYRIELLIFSHQSESAQTSETWDPTPVLVYPQRARFLVDPELIAKNLAMFDATSEMDELGHQTLTIIPPPPEDETEINKQGAPEPEEVQAAPEEVLSAPEEVLPAPEEVQAAPEELLPKTPTAFTLLPGSELEFRGKAAYMQRTGRYRTLFHETWVQPIASESSALPIIIDRSGDAEDWPRLQGSIKFHLSRYLHLETNLWLNTAGDYLPQDWQMPAAPLGPQSLTIIYPPEPEPEPVVEPEPIESGFYTPINIDSTDHGENELLEPPGPIYPWRHAIALQQKRKMRSTELHYIDHPMLGVVVKITPLTEEELQERAVAEVALSQASDEAANR